MLRKNIFRYPILGILAVIVASGVASAQDTGATGGAAHTAPVPFEAMVDTANSHLGTMENTRATIRRKLEDARANNDVVKTLCLDDKLNQVDVAIRSAKDRNSSLQAAVSQGNQDLANHEWTIFSVLHQRVLTLNIEADQCIGKEVVYVEGSSVKMEVTGDMPFEEADGYPDMPVLALPPNCASCFL